jgi:exosome complex RNA-binding protein Rrp42 (RNase PH superfamily)
MQEEQCVSTTLHLCVNAKGQLISIQKSGSSADGGLEPSRLLDMIQTAGDVGVDLYTRLEKQLG